MKASFKQIVFKMASAALGLTIALVIAEILFSGYYWYIDGVYLPVRQKLLEETNTYIQAVTREQCSYADTMLPHPYLGFVHHAYPPCGFQNVNTQGMYGREYPFEKRTDQYVILLTGGSVVAQMAGAGSGWPNHLEVILNERYECPRRTFVVLNGGIGAWKQPQQLILFEMYADVIDAVITLDGYNEHYFMRSWHRMEYPANNFVEVNPILEAGRRNLLSLALNERIRKFTFHNLVISHSKLCYFLSKTIRDSLARSVESPGGPPAIELQTVANMFALPESWSQQERLQWNINQYKKYIRMMDRLSRDMGIRNAHFIQPCPAVAKRLTLKERRIAGDLNYAASYSAMTDAIMSLGSQGVPVYSLLKVFADYEGTVYADHIHCEVKEEDKSSEGYRIIAEHIARTIARDWKLIPKHRLTH